jgi:hypothetical protein
MGAGHYAAAVMLGRAEPRLNAGVLFFCAILADVLLGVLILAGVEEVHVPPTFAIRHSFEFTFPYSHGLAATLVWTAAATFAASRYLSWRAAWIAGAAVFSHFVLDVLVHVPEIPVAGEESRKLGLALWDHLAVALTLEAAMVIVAIAMCRGWGMRVLMLLTGVVMIGGQAAATTAPRPSVLAWNWIFTGLAISAIAFWLDRRRRRAETRRVSEQLD